MISTSFLTYQGHRRGLPEAMRSPKMGKEARAALKRSSGCGRSADNREQVRRWRHSHLNVKIKMLWMTADLCSYEVGGQGSEMGFVRWG